MDERIKHSLCGGMRCHAISSVCYLLSSEELYVDTRLPSSFTHKKVWTVLSKYAFERWRKDVRMRHTYIVMNVDDL